MDLLPVSSLSSWIRCPRQFYSQMVLKTKEPVNGAMALGLVKHKFHEFVSESDEQIISSITQSNLIQATLEQSYTQLLRKAVLMYGSLLRQLDVPVAKALDTGVVLGEVAMKAELLSPLIQKGILGRELWNNLQPKIKSEYKVESKTLKLKGRIDKLECYPNKIVPIELKSGMTPKEGVFEEHKIQAASYAILLEEAFQTDVKEAVVHYVDSKQRRTIVMNPFIKDWILETRDKALDCMNTQEVPKGCQKESCSTCKLMEKN